MARVTTFTGWSGASDADFRAFVGEYLDMLEDAGLVRTADTGQINVSTITRSSSYTAPAVFRFNDALQATAPLFIIVSFQCNTSEQCRVSVTLCTATNGAGVASGVVATGDVGTSIKPGTASYHSLATHSDGCAAMVWKIKGGVNTYFNVPGSFIAARSVDNTGAPTADGAMLICGGAVSLGSYGSFRTMRFDLNLVTDPVQTQFLGIIPGGIADSRVSWATQAFLTWMMLPKQTPMTALCAFVEGEVPMLEQVELALVGTTPRNYINVGNAFAKIVHHNGNTDTAILWED